MQNAKLYLTIITCKAVNDNPPLANKEVRINCHLKVGSSPGFCVPLVGPSFPTPAAHLRMKSKLPIKAGQSCISTAFCPVLGPSYFSLLPFTLSLRFLFYWASCSSSNTPCFLSPWCHSLRLPPPKLQLSQAPSASHIEHFSHRVLIMCLYLCSPPVVCKLQRKVPIFLLVPRWTLHWTHVQALSRFNKCLLNYMHEDEKMASQKS